MFNKKYKKSNFYQDKNNLKIGFNSINYSINLFSINTQCDSYLYPNFISLSFYLYIS